MIVYLLSEEQKLEVDGQTYTQNYIFTPEFSNICQWYLPEYQVDDTTNEEFLWVKTLFMYDLQPSPTQSNI